MSLRRREGRSQFRVGFCSQKNKFGWEDESRERRGGGMG
jgi:hypothetical protein